MPEPTLPRRMPLEERSYVPHAVTGEPVPVLTEAEQEAQVRERRSNPSVRVSAVRCWCGNDRLMRRRDGFWMHSGDMVQMDCPKGHTVLLRFAPETVGR